MKTLRVYASQIEADVAKGLLDQNGIKCFIFADDQGGMIPALDLTNGVAIKVDEKDFEVASKLLKDAQKEVKDAAAK